MNGKVVLVLNVFNIIVVLKASTILEKGVSEKEKKEIVDAHNELRLRLANGIVPKQPKATNMKKLCWDDALAYKAQLIADKMDFEHEKVSDDRWRTVGQNLALSASTGYRKGAKWTWAITQWFDEVRFYTFGDRVTAKTGHYTQVAWGRTGYVGCGYTAYENPKAKFKYAKLYVCNYGPGGNIRGLTPYLSERCGCIGLCKHQCGCIKPKS